MEAKVNRMERQDCCRMMMLGLIADREEGGGVQKGLASKVKQAKSGVMASEAFSISSKIRDVNTR